MEERCTREVSDRDAAIETLKVEIERLEGEKWSLSDSLTALRLSLAEKERERDGLRVDLAKAREAEVLSAEQTRRASELAEGLRRELASEKESAAAVREQLSLTTRRLDSVKGVLAATVGHYRATVAELGGETSAPPEEDSVYALASWLKRHLAKLPGLINGCTDYGALAGVANYAKLLARGGCTHTKSIPEGALPGPEELGETSLGLRKTLRNFIGHFWAPFGRSAARKLAEDKRVKVLTVFVVAPFLLFSLLLPLTF